MALDLYAGGSREAVKAQDEFLFQLAAEDARRYPRLSAIWTGFYDDPSQTAEQAGAVVHELIDLLAANGGMSNGALASVALRLMSFFSAAYRQGVEVKAVSD